MTLQAEISRVAAALAQNLSFDQRFDLGEAIANVSTLEEIPEPYKSQISALIEKDQY